MRLFNLTFLQSSHASLQFAHLPIRAFLRKCWVLLLPSDQEVPGSPARQPPDTLLCSFFCSRLNPGWAPWRLVCSENKARVETSHGKHRENREKLPWEYLICCRGVKLFLLKDVPITTIVTTVTITTITIWVKFCHNLSFQILSLLSLFSHS